MTLRFGTDGVRAEALTVLTTEYVSALARAAAQVLGGDMWLVGRDTRESGPVLEGAVSDGLISAGVSPLLLGVVPTPALAWMSAQMNVPAIMITASHNPWQDNGVKVFAQGGLKLTDDVERSIEERSHDTAPADVDDPPIATAHDWRDGYVAHLVGVEQSLKGLRVVLDCANGATFETAPAVFRALHADVTVIHAEPNGRNINDNCGATNTASLATAVVERGAHMGLAFDGDGDRVIAIDHQGQAVDGDRLIALAALQLRDEGALKKNSVVVTVMSNLGFHKAMAAAGIEVVTTAVGDRYVLEALATGGYSIGGEQSGHIIYRDLATTGDGLLAGVRLAHFVHSSGRSLAELASEVMTSYPQVLVNVKVRERHPQVADELADEIASATSDLGGEGRVLVRPSGTEPLIRVMVEASTQADAQQVADDLAKTVLQRFS